MIVRVVREMITPNGRRIAGDCFRRIRSNVVEWTVDNLTINLTIIRN